jgi:uncharacterized protein with GYD domain
MGRGMQPTKKGGNEMVNYIVLVNWTDQGIKAAKDSAKRFDAARKLAKKLGCTLGDVYLTIGPYDLVAMFEAPDDETAARFNLTLASGGNVRTTTLKAFPEDAYRKIVASL